MYQATVRREHTFRSHGDCWVARDHRGIPRAYAEYECGATPAEAIAAMYHVLEIDSVEDHGSWARASIIEFEQSQAD